MVCNNYLTGELYQDMYGCANLKRKKFKVGFSLVWFGLSKFLKGVKQKFKKGKIPFMIQKHILGIL